MLPILVVSAAGTSDERVFDVVIAGGTASGVAAALTAAEEGMRVAVVEPTSQLGGMMSSGVSKTDIGFRDSSNGLFEVFRKRVKAHYGGDPLCEDGFKYEPKVARAVLHAMVAEKPGIEVFLRHRPAAIVKAAPNRVAGLVIEDHQGRRIVLRARVTIDATDEGDVAVWAGAQYRVGREARSAEEPHAGVIYLDRGGINPRDKSVPHLYRILPQSTGAGDHRTQAFSFLMTLKDYGGASGPGSRHVLNRPPVGYDPASFRHVTPWEKTWAVFSGVLPGRKFEVNQYPFGVELPGGNEGYLEGDRATRAAIVERHKQRALAYLYHLQHVEGKYNLGLPDDEYEENGGFPVQLYVRQGRRIAGRYTLNESDINPFLKGDGVRPPFFYDAIATGTFPVDVHPVREKTSPADPDNGEGELFLPEVTAPFQVPLRCLMPEGVEGLLVSQAISSTHIAYQAVRLEAVRMSIGMAAGIAAAVSVNGRRPLESVDSAAVQERLIRAGSMLYVFRDVRPGSKYFEAVQRLGLAMGAPAGFDDYTFRPEEAVTRAQLAEMLVRAFRMPISVTSLHFKDVPRRHLAARYVETLYDRGFLTAWMPPECDLFGPDSPVKAEEFETMLAQVAGRTAAPGKTGTSTTRGAAAAAIVSVLASR